MKNWDHLKDLTKDELIQRVIVGEGNQYNLSKAWEEMKQRAERAEAIAEVAQVVINSAKVEVDHMKLTGGKGSGFITEKLPAPGQPRLVKGRDMAG